MEAIAYVFIIMILITVYSLLIAFAYRRGLKDGLDIRNNRPLETALPKTKRAERPKADERTEAILRNIERYDGTGTGQKDIT